MTRILVFLALSLAISLPASASLTYELTFSQTNVSLGTGQSITLDILFRETATGGFLHRLDLAGGTNGLTDANFRVTRSGTGATFMSGITGNNLFDFDGGPVGTLDNPLSTVEQAIFSNDPVFASIQSPVTGGTMRTAQVGSLTLTASNLLGDVNVFQLGDFGAGVDFLIDYGFLGLDFAADSLMSFGSVTVTAVPEPSSLVLLGIAGLIGGNRLRRLRKISESKNVSPTTAS